MQVQAEFARERFRSWRFFGLSLAVFLTVHLLLSLALSGSFSPDDADQLIFSQTLAWGYYEQPPLYSWLTYLFFHVLGLNYLSYYVVKSLALGLIYLACFLCARSLVVSGRGEVLAAFSPILISTFAWHSFSYLTSSNLVCAATAATCYALVRLQQRDSLGNYLLLGILLGLGLLSKYNFIFVAAGLLLAGLTIRSIRARLVDRRFLLSLGLAGFLVLPHAAWLYQHRMDLQTILSQKINPNSASLLPGRMLGILRLLENTALLLLPAAGIALLFCRFLEPTKSMDDRQRLLARFFPALLLLLLGFILLCGAARFHERWLYPFVILVPLCGWCRFRFRSEAAFRAFGFVLLGIAVVCGGVRVAQVFVGGFDRGTYPLQMNFAPAAEQLRAFITRDSVIISRDREICGNLRYRLPEALHVCSSHPLYVPKLNNLSGSRVLVWNTANGIVPPPDLRSFAVRVLGLTIPQNPEIQFVDVPPRLSGRRLNRLAFLVLPK